MPSFRAHGKLLITAEYLVLLGARALAIPTQRGQRMSVTPRDAGGTEWLARDHRGHVRFHGYLGQGHADLAFAEQLVQAANGNNAYPNALVETDLEFAAEWGWGSSSSLTALVAAWQQVDPMALHHSVSQGSGFDVACAHASGPIVYQRERPVQSVDLNAWPTDHIRFMYLGQKQDSQKEVAKFANRDIANGVIERMNALTDAFIQAKSAPELMKLMNAHESLMSDVLSQPTIKEQLFRDSAFAFKSLGAWGGDFVMVVAEDPSEFGYLNKSNRLLLSWAEIF